MGLVTLDLTSCARTCIVRALLMWRAGLPEGAARERCRPACRCMREEGSARDPCALHSAPATLRMALYHCYE